MILLLHDGFTHVVVQAKFKSSLAGKKILSVLV